MATELQLQANRENAQLSTGPKTSEGKAKVAHNAVKNALSGATVLLPTDDAALYELHIANTNAVWAPAGHREQIVVQSIADTEWRLLRIPTLIANIFALGRITHSELFAEQPEPLREGLLEAHIEITYVRNLRNLHLQESRLLRNRQNAIEELQQLQRARLQERNQQLEAAAKMHIRFEEEEIPFDPAEFGFEFSIDEIEERVGLHEAKRIGCNYPRQFAKYIHAKLLREERLGILPEEEDEAA